MTFSAVLLVGGESRRMGREKATIVFGGSPLWQRQLKILRDLDPGRIFVSSRIRPAWLPPDAETVLDETPSRGPMSGLTAALMRMEATHLIVLAVDMPFMTSAEMQILLGLAVVGRGVVPVINDRAEPLAAVYPREVAADFATALAGDSFSLQPLIQKLERADKIRFVTVAREKRHLYRSVNTPEDLGGI